MTLEPDEKRVICEARLEKAREFLDDAKAALGEGRHRTAVNRAYYAALNAVRANLVLVGANPASHEGVVTLLSLRLIKTGRLPVEVVKQFKILATRRLDVDYGDFDAVGTEEATASVVTAGDLVARLGTLAGELIAELPVPPGR